MLYLIAFVAGFLFCGGLITDNKAFLFVSLFLIVIAYLSEVGKELNNRDE